MQRERVARSEADSEHEGDALGMVCTGHGTGDTDSLSAQIGVKGSTNVKF